MTSSNFTADDIEILEHRTLYQGFFTLAEYSFRHRLFAGGWSDIVTREVFERGNAVVVLPYDPRLDLVVLIEQVRLPALATSRSPWLLELVAGMIGEGESAEEVAHRELAEETGLKADRILPVSSYLASPGGTSERMYFFLAEVDASQARGLHGLEHEHEDIKVQVMSRERAYNQVVSGGIDNASTVIGLQWLELNYRSLRQMSAR
jgi:ADP-ribose pyrophosphatase